MADSIDLSGHELMQQAGWTAQSYMGEAVTQIDAMLGEGTAAKNPSLIGMFMLTAAIDMHSAILSQQLRAGLDSVADQISGVAGQLSNISESL